MDTAVLSLFFPQRGSPILLLRLMLERSGARKGFIVLILLENLHARIQCLDLPL